MGTFIGTSTGIGSSSNELNRSLPINLRDAHIDDEIISGEMCVCNPGNWQYAYPLYTFSFYIDDVLYHRDENVESGRFNVPDRISGKSLFVIVTAFNNYGETSVRTGIYTIR